MEILQGPFIWVCLGISLLGILFHVIRFFALTEKPPKPNIKTIAKGKFPFLYRLHYQWYAIEHSLIGKNLILLFVSTVFHALLIATPLFVLGHITMLGLNLPTLPETTADYLTLTVIACAIFLLARRLFWVRILAITKFTDVLLLAITTAPFVTGFLAYHQIGDYDTVMLIHMLSGGLMLAAIPFTRLSHCIDFFLNRIGRVWENPYNEVKVGLASCPHCGFCAESCFKVQNNKRLWWLTPVYKMITALRSYNPRETRKNLWRDCELCTRCRCLMGINIPRIIAAERDTARLCGIYPNYGKEK